MKLLNKISIILIVLVTISGCQMKGRSKPASEDKDSSTSAAPLVHTVKYSGETLGIISAWYTGNAQNWRTIEKANKGIQVNKILLGDKIKIPTKLLKKREKLTQKFVSGFYGGSTPRNSGSSIPSVTQKKKAPMKEESLLAEDSPFLPDTARNDSVSLGDSEEVVEIPQDSSPGVFNQRPTGSWINNGEATKNNQEQIIEQEQIQVPPVAPPAPESNRSKTREQLLEELLGGE